KIHPVDEIASRHRTRAAGETSESEDLSEEVPEVGEDRGIEAAEPSSGGRTDARVPEPLVTGALVRVREDRVGLGRLFELLGGVWIVRISIRMVLQRELAVSGLQLLSVGVWPDTEDFEIVALTHDSTFKIQN